jgi:membrane-associated phospholipid phosphatase
VTMLHSAARRGCGVVLLAGTVAAPAATHGRGVSADRRLSRFVVERRRLVVAEPARRLTNLGSPAPVCATLGATAVIALVAGSRPETVALRVGSAAAGVAVRRLVAEAVRRPRPPQSWWWENPSGFSYPSRHVTWAALGYGAAADLLAGTGSARAARLVAMGTVGVIAGTRVLLAVHWPTDVLAAATYACGWRLLTALEPAQALPVQAVDRAE